MRLFPHHNINPHPTIASTAVLGSGTVATRNPKLLLSPVGSKPLYRFEDCKLLASSRNEPPRKPRNAPLIKASFHSHTLPPWSDVP